MDNRNKRAQEAKDEGSAPVQAAGVDRLAEAVDAEAPPRLAFPVVGIGASAGGIEACIEFFKSMKVGGAREKGEIGPEGMAYVIVQHLSPDRSSLVAEILAKHSPLPTKEADDGMVVEAGHVYVIRPDRTLTINEGRLHLGEPVQKRGHRHPVDDFFRSLAAEQRERAIAVVLSGMGSNGTAGAQAVKAVGGLCIAQEPESAKFPSMPRSMIEGGAADLVLRPEQISETLVEFARHPYSKASETRRQTLEREDAHAFKEILSVLRARVKREFSEYKTPTVVRRIQRRMSLHQMMTLTDYARLVRQNLVEAEALADDLVIHVTGFFRDPEAWETLRTKVIMPRLAERDGHSQFRAWVTACSSGEEAYTLAILIDEAAEAAGRPVDAKVFATDLADRMLSHARAGIYPLGIESEVRPDRLEKYFDKDENSYRIKKSIRDMVVFAPQNILRDPPFSRLDLCTCRNLLIYLEAQVQKRVLALLHFGLRDGGVLFLGNAETITGSDEPFDTLDKRWRIYRKSGPSRRAAGEFPAAAGLGLLGVVGSAGVTANGGSGASGLEASERLINAAMRNVRPSIPQLTQRALLERHTPAAVVVDRQQRIVYFHGETGRFFNQPQGEPTREVLAVARESVRAALRLALHRAISDNAPARVRDGFVQTERGRERTEISAAPLIAQGGGDGSAPAEWFLVSFETWLEPEPPSGTVENAANIELVRELRNVSDQLQGTIEELQTSNEELKAANEEIISVNEELQSTNEELETGKEELQSFNEELTTVNTQLEGKMEELESANNDMASLLSSTDIAVLFLDTLFRIRRYTPAVQRLIELRPTDVGRPLSDMARKFTDPELNADARAVLERLTPSEREVATEGGRLFIRRVLPYRTSDNRIDGVVITFVDITSLREAEAARHRSEEMYRLMVEGVREYAIFILDGEGRVTTWNVGAERALGYTEAEAVGRLAECIFTPDERKSGALRTMLTEARTRGETFHERWYQRKDGSLVWGSGMLKALTDPLGASRGFAMILRDNTERKLNTERIHALRKDAEANAVSKTHFVTSIADGLHQPASVIVEWAEELKRGGLSADGVKLATEMITRAAIAQQQLIDELKRPIDEAHFAAAVAAVVASLERPSKQ